MLCRNQNWLQNDFFFRTYHTNRHNAKWKMKKFLRSILNLKKWMNGLITLHLVIKHTWDIHGWFNDSSGFISTHMRVLTKVVSNVSAEFPYLINKNRHMRLEKILRENESKLKMWCEKHLTSLYCLVIAFKTPL